MPPSIRERIAAALDDAIAAGLAADGGAPVTRLERARQQAIDDRQRPAYLVILGAEQAIDPPVTGIDQYETEAQIWGFVIAQTNENPETVLHDLHARLVRAALADPQLGGLADEVRYVAMEHDLQAIGGRRTADLTITLAIRYHTAPGDPTQQ